MISVGLHFKSEILGLDSETLDEWRLDGLKGWTMTGNVANGLSDLPNATSDEQLLEDFLHTLDPAKRLLWLQDAEKQSSPTFHTFFAENCLANREETKNEPFRPREGT
jgi:hypothetical protein